MNPRTLIAACLAVALLGACRPAEPPPGVDAAVEDTPAAAPAGTGAPPATQYPALVVTTIDGESWDLADRRGRWVVVNFWATWCAPCLKEMPELSALDAMREHIEVIGLAYEDTDAATLRGFLEAHPVVYPVAIVDTFEPPPDLPTPRGLPLTCLVDPDGRMVRTFLGPVTAAELEQAIAEAGGPAPGEPG